MGDHRQLKRIFGQGRAKSPDATHGSEKIETAIPLAAAMLSGAAIGLLSGMTGVGGGIFLTPLLLLMGWAETKPSSGVSAAFILVNSIAGILGHLSSLSQIPDSIPYLALAAVVGGVDRFEFWQSQVQ